MTEGQVYGARRNPATPVDRRQDDAPNYYLDWAFDEMRKLVENFRNRSPRLLLVRTALDPNLQHYAEREVESDAAPIRPRIRRRASRRSSSPISTARVRAMVGGRDYGASQFNRAVDALRQPGSSFKPYVYATALANGFTPTIDRRRFAGVHRQLVPAQLFRRLFGLDDADTSDHQFGQHHSGQAVDRAGRRQSEARPRQDHSDRAQFGIYTPLPDTPSLPIGADEVNVLEHAVAYATFPNLGKAVTPHAALEVRTGTGELIWRFDRDGKRPQQVISPQVAMEMIGMMNSVVENGTGKRAQLDGIQVAGKTGTTNGYRDAWFVGYTGNFGGAVWMGNDDYTPTKRMTGGTHPGAHLAQHHGLRAPVAWNCDRSPDYRRHNTHRPSPMPHSRARQRRNKSC